MFGKKFLRFYNPDITKGLQMERRKETRTTMLKARDAGKKSWYVIDASNKTLGRLSSEVAKILRGKHKVTFTPHVSSGDGVIVINAEKVRLTGAKKAQKTYRYYTGYIGGMREVPFENMLARNPGYVIFHAVKGMLPKTRLGNKQIKSLRVIKGGNYREFQAQKPVVLSA